MDEQTPGTPGKQSMQELVQPGETVVQKDEGGAWAMVTTAGGTPVVRVRMPDGSITEHPVEAAAGGAQAPAAPAVPASAKAMTYIAEASAGVAAAEGIAALVEGILKKKQ